MHVAHCVSNWGVHRVLRMKSEEPCVGVGFSGWRGSPAGLCSQATMALAFHSKGDCEGAALGDPLEPGEDAPPHPRDNPSSWPRGAC